MSQLQGRKILVVDDEPDLREIIREEMELEGATVVEAESGQQALELALQDRFDAIISDIRMAKGTGIEVLDTLRRQDGEQPLVVLITGFADISHEIAYAKGADAILTKPFPMSELTRTVIRGLQPPDQRYLRKFERKDMSLSVSCKLENFPVAAAARALNLGRGGMFISWTGPFPKVGDLVEFYFEFSNGKDSIIQGVGLCRWVRENSRGRLPSGFGIEFQSVDVASIKNLETLLDRQNTLSHIPRS